MKTPGTGEEAVKSWEKPWTTDDMRNQSQRWNLAGDTGLLRHIQQFSENMISQTHAIQKEVDDVLHQTKLASVNVNNTINAFMMLANTQFVENRVYDDSEEKDGGYRENKKEEKVKTKEEREQELVPRITEALAIGMSVLNNAFEKVSVADSDSEDDGNSSHLLRAKDPYKSRPLPYLIGSKEFMEDDKVGLYYSSSDEESEVETSSPVDDRKNDFLWNHSESDEMSDDVAHVPSFAQQIPSAISNMSAISNQSSSSSEDDSPLFKGNNELEESQETIKEEDSLQAELNAKLGIARKTKHNDKKPEGDIFDSTPTIPAEGEDPLFGRQSDIFKSKGLFSSGNSVKGSSGGLFDDDYKEEEDDWLSGAAFSKRRKTSGVFDNESDTSTPKKQIPTPAVSSIRNRVKDGLFDDEDNEDLFARVTNIQKNKVEEVSSIPRSGDIAKTTKKPPIGGVSILGGINPFADRTPPPMIDSETSSIRSSRSASISSQSSKFDSKPESISNKGGDAGDRKSGNVDLFADDDDDFLFSSIKPTKKLDNSLFSKPKSTLSIPSTGTKPKLRTGGMKASTLFDDSDSGDDLFSSASSTSSRSSKNIKPPSKSKKGLFEDDSSLFSTNSMSIIPDVDIFANTDNVFAASTASKQPKSDVLPSEKVEPKPKDALEAKPFDLGNDDFDLFAPHPSKSKVPSPVRTNSKGPKLTSLFSDEDSDLFTDVAPKEEKPNIFSSPEIATKGKNDVIEEATIPKRDNLFTTEDPTTIHEPTDDLFTTTAVRRPEQVQIAEDDLFSSMASAKEKPSDMFLSNKSVVPPLRDTKIDNSDSLLDIPIEYKSNSILFDTKIDNETSSQVESFNASEIESKDNISTDSFHSVGDKTPRKMSLFSDANDETPKKSSLSSDEKPKKTLLFTDDIPKKSSIYFDANDDSDLFSSEPEIPKKHTEPIFCGFEPPPLLSESEDDFEPAMGPTTNYDSSEDDTWDGGKQSLPVITPPTTKPSVPKKPVTLNKETVTEGPIAVAKELPIITELPVTKDTTVTKDSTKVPSNINKNFPVFKEPDEPIAVSPTKSPGKLLINPGLNINPLALLPNPKLTSKSIGESGVGFDRPADTKQTLPSMLKKRVKIQTKRPPTRACRQKAAASSIDDSTTIAEERLQRNEGVSNPLTPSTEEEDLFFVPFVKNEADESDGLFTTQNTILRLTTTDLFMNNEPKEDTFKTVEVEKTVKRISVIGSDLATTKKSRQTIESVHDKEIFKQTKSKANPVNLFSDDDNDDLFGSYVKRPEKSFTEAKSITEKKRSGLNIEFENDSDLFGAAVGAKPITTLPREKKRSGGFIFDHSDCDDLFSSTPQKSLVTSTKPIDGDDLFSSIPKKSVVTSTKPKPNKSQKPKSEDIFDDPLFSTQI